VSRTEAVEQEVNALTQVPERALDEQASLKAVGEAHRIEVTKLGSAVTALREDHGEGAAGACVERGAQGAGGRVVGGTSIRPGGRTRARDEAEERCRARC
jgi:hypothetical protein